MGFASTWLEERALFPSFIKEAPDEETGIIVVVPAYNEPGIADLLNSLASCDLPDCKVEVLVVLNAPAEATEESILNNVACIRSIEIWIDNNPNCFFRPFIINVIDSSDHDWGVGLARKTGMDEAVRRFNMICKPDGVILNLDADCQVARNYFVSVAKELLEKRERSACSIYFEHPLSGYSFHEEVYKYITWYELHLRYYLQGLKYSCFPYAFHTVGSAIGVKALPYIKAGGMNKRKAGEDFYFIQKLVTSGSYFTLNSTAVYPSPRASYRVPFGTGATILKLTNEKPLVLLTYNVNAFKELNLFFGAIEQLYTLSGEELECFYYALPAGLRSFIVFQELKEKLKEIKGNTDGLQSFRKRFFGWFNMFRIVKFLNQVHKEIYKKVPVNECAHELLHIIGTTFASKDSSDLLRYYRSMEKDS
jgi:hypothetical protein